MTNFRLFKTERVCRRIFKVYENGRNVSKMVYNTVGKGEIACYEQFLLFSQCFLETCIANMKKKPGLIWERVKNGW